MTNKFRIPRKLFKKGIADLKRSGVPEPYQQETAVALHDKIYSELSALEGLLSIIPLANINKETEQKINFAMKFSLQTLKVITSFQKLPNDEIDSCWPATKTCMDICLNVLRETSETVKTCGGGK